MNDTVVSDEEAFWIDRVTFVNKTIAQYGMSFIWLLGNVGLVFTCIVFLQPTFRQSPCAMYFIASSLSQIITFNFGLITRMIHFGYHIEVVNQYVWFCKVRFYVFYTFIAIPRYDLILASIDRYFASSRDARRRRWSSSKAALRLIICNIIFWCSIYIQVLIFYRIENDQCVPESGVYATFYSIYLAIDSGIMPTLLMFTFGLLTIRNIHGSKRHIAPIDTSTSQTIRNNRISKKDNQLYRMLASQILLFICLNTLNPCYLLYQSFTIRSTKSLLHKTVDLFVSNMSCVLIYLGFSLTFPTFLISSDMFRQEFIQVFVKKRILPRRRRNP